MMRRMGNWLLGSCLEGYLVSMEARTYIGCVEADFLAT